MQGIVFLLHSPLVKRDYNRFGIEILQKNFNVYVFDMTALYRPEYYQKKAFEIHSYPGYYSLSSRKEFVLLLDRLSINHAIDFINISWDSFFIRNKLKAKGISITKVQNGLLLRSSETPAVSKVKDYIINPIKWKNFLFTAYKALFPRSFFSSDSILIGGLAGEHLSEAKYSKELIPAHSFDYDIYLKLKEEKPVNSQPYAVFIDQYMVNHPNYVWLGIKPYVTEEAYYPSLEAFFADFESKTGMEIVVAAHPRARYDLYPDIFGGRMLYHGNTAELIRDSSIVLQHVSTAVSFAVLWNKPIMFLSTNEMINSSMVNSLNEYCNFFSKSPLNMDNYTEEELLKQIQEPINEIKYREYTDQFMRYPGSPDNLFWQIYADHLLEKSRKQDAHIFYH